MNLPTGIRSEFIKPIATVIAPGLFTLYPYLYVADHYFPGLWQSVMSPTPTAATVLIVAAVAVGMIIEDIGARIEVWTDSALDAESKRHVQNWFKYLSHCGPEPIGFRYISTVVVRLKFELAMLVSSVAAIGACLWLLLLERFSCPRGIVFIALLLAVAIYELLEARSSMRLLSQLRDELLPRLVANSEKDAGKEKTG